MKLTLEQAEAIVRLQNNGDFKAVIEALNAYRQELFEFTMYGKGDDVHTYRGMARGATEVQRALSGARSFIEQARTRK